MLVLSADLLGSELAGASMRAYELAMVLRAHAEVTLAGLRADTPPPAGLPTATYELRDPKALRSHIASADVVFAQPQWPVIAGWLRRSGAKVIYDLYTPEPLEIMAAGGGRRLLRRLVLTLTLDRIVAALHTGDHFVCAGEQQRDLWLGCMLAERILSPGRYDRDQTLRSLIDSVPFGVSPEPPVRRGRGIRARFPQIGPDDEIALWSGGIWNWLDAQTSIRAAALLARRRPRFRLVFMGASAAGAARAATEQAISLARELGVHERVVFFNDRWVPYGQRADWLLEANCALSTHLEQLETRFAFRTRTLDCFWTGLPVVCTWGDELAARIARDGLGETVPPRDPHAVASALERVLERGREAFARPMARVAEEYAWPRLAEPLVRYVTDPSPARRCWDGQSRRPAHLARDAGFRAAMGALNLIGAKRVPFL